MFDICFYNVCLCLCFNNLLIGMFIKHTSLNNSILQVDLHAFVRFTCIYCLYRDDQYTLM